MRLLMAMVRWLRDVLFRALSPAELQELRQNVLFYPATPSPASTGLLASTTGGLETDTSLRPRVSAILGPAATLTGLAELLLPLYEQATAADGTPAPTVEQIAQAIVVYNRYYLPAPALTHYRCGLRLPLPIEIDAAHDAWIVNAAGVRQLASAFDASWSAVLTQTPSNLSQPDSLAVEADAASLVASATDYGAAGIQLFSRVMRNPFAEVYLVQAALSRGAQFSITLGLFSSAVTHQVELLASTSAGRATLLRAQSALSHVPVGIDAPREAAMNRARAMISNALTEVLGHPLNRELPEVGSHLTDRTGAWFETQNHPQDPVAGQHRLVLGRDVLAGKMGRYNTYYGPAYGGRISPVQFAQTHSSDINPGGDARRQARLDVVVAIAPNEGFLDAVRLRDRAVLSVGLQQWTSMTVNELPAMLWRFQQAAPDDFALFFGLYGLALDPRASPNRVVLQYERPDGTVTDILTFSEQCDFFDGKFSGTTMKFGTTWAARVRTAAINSHAFKLAQFEMAIARFDRILHDVGTITVGTQQLGLDTVITSRMGAALILDSHINKPGRVRSDLLAAASYVAANLPLPSTIAEWDVKITARYLVSRDVYDQQIRNQRIISANLNTTHGSFAGW